MDSGFFPLRMVCCQKLLFCKRQEEAMSSEALNTDLYLRRPIKLPCSKVNDYFFINVI